MLPYKYNVKKWENKPVGTQWKKVGQVEPKAGKYNRQNLTSAAMAAAAKAHLEGLSEAYVIASAGGYAVCRLRDIPPNQQAVKVSPWGDVYKLA